MNLESYIQSRLDCERKLLVSDSFSDNDRLQIWISTIKNAPRSVDAIQTLMDTKEVEMNQVSCISELQRLDREWSALEWLKKILRQAKNEQIAVKR